MVDQRSQKDMSPHRYSVLLPSSKRDSISGFTGELDVDRRAPRIRRKSTARHPASDDHWKSNEKILAEAERILWAHPNYRVSLDYESVRIHSPYPNGFDIALLIDCDQCTLVLGQWYDDFASPSEALSYLKLALTGEIRLRIQYAEDIPFKWTIQRIKPSGRWSNIDSMSILRTSRPRGKSKRSIYRRNI